MTTRGRHDSAIAIITRWRIAEALFITEAAVEKHVTSIFHKLELAPAPGGHRRVLAVLRYLRGTADIPARAP